MSTELSLTLVDGENCIDSHLVAQALGIEHRAFIRILYRYQGRLEGLGLLRFEDAAVKTPEGRGTKYTTYAMLNEDQAIFAATLSRNTEQVVDFKLALTQAFSAARKQLPASPAISLHPATQLLIPRMLSNRSYVPEGHFTVLD